MISIFVKSIESAKGDFCHWFERQARKVDAHAEAFASGQKLNYPVRCDENPN
jgi:hypothetical protein